MKLPNQCHRKTPRQIQVLNIFPALMQDYKIISEEETTQ